MNEIFNFTGFLIILGYLYKIDRKQTIATTEAPLIKKDIRRAHKRIDDNDDKLNDHDVRIVKLEQKNEYD